MNRTRDLLDEMRERVRDIREHVHDLADKVNVLWGERYLRLTREAREKKEQEKDGGSEE
jgi:hypothetical protein